MEDQVYETDDDYSLAEIKKFEEWFDRIVGTDYERNESASGEPDQYYLMCFEMTPKEVEKMRAYELRFREGRE